MEETDPTANKDALLADLRKFGPPLFVPHGTWWVAGFERTNGRPDAVLVFGGTGEVQIRTELLTRTRQPLSIRVSSVQHASVNSPDAATRAQYERVAVEEAERDLEVGGALHTVRVLTSHNVFSLEVVVEDRLVCAAGVLPALDSLRIEALAEPRLTSG